MKFRATVISAAIAGMLAFMPAAMGSAAQRVGAYDFTYLTSGDLRATPVQTFDNGKVTYFQFRAGEQIPAIFSNVNGNIQLLVPTFEGPYVRVESVAARFMLQLGRAQAQVVYGGGGREGALNISSVNDNGLRSAYKGGYPSDPRVKLVASLEPTLPGGDPGAVDANSYATPVKGDRVSWVDSEVQNEAVKVWFPRAQAGLAFAAKRDLLKDMAKFKAATRLTIVGRDDDSYKEGLESARALAIKDLLVKSGVVASRITVKTGVGSDPVKGQWASEIRLETVSPTSVARRDPAAAALAERRSHIQALVQDGMLTPEQARAMLTGIASTAGSEGAPQVVATRDIAKPALKEKAPEVPPEVPPGGFDFRANDKTVSQSIKRWAAATKYQIVWEAPSLSDAAITGDGQMVAASMPEAVDKLVAALQRKGYDINATLYSNRVFRFTGSMK